MSPLLRILTVLLTLSSVVVSDSCSADKKSDEAPIADPEKFETRRYHLPSPQTPLPDFNAPPAPPKPVRLTSREIFEAYEIEFPEGATSKYDPLTGSLTIRHTRKGFASIEKVLESLGPGREKQINLRVEIYELPKETALELQEAMAALPDHREQLNEVRALVKKGAAKFLTSTELIARSGQRSRTESIRELKAVSEYEWDEKAKALLPRIETVQTGLTFEADPVLGPDDETIDLNFSLEHRSEDPKPRLTKVHFPNEEKPREIPFPVIHTAKIITQATMKDGNALFMGVFKPQPIGQNEPDPEKTWAVFLMPTIQFLDGGVLDYELISTEAAKEEEN